MECNKDGAHNNWRAKSSERKKDGVQSRGSAKKVAAQKSGSAKKWQRKKVECWMEHKITGA